MTKFENIEEIKEFLVWAKSERIKKIEVAGISAEFSDLAFVGDFADLSNDKSTTTAELSSSTTPTDIQEEPVNNEETDEDLLFHSAR